MDKARKRQIKNYIAMGCVALLVALLAAMPLLARSEEDVEGPVASILSATAASGEVSTTLHGGGTLTEEEAQELTIPSGVKLTGFLVENGTAVAAGDPVATVDRVSVMTAIAELQETLVYLQEQIETAREQEVSDEIVAQGGGHVKIIYAQEGDDVRSVMLEHGALAVLSLDSLMAVKIETDVHLMAGDSVTVTFPDETQVSGRVETYLGGTMTVTVNDEGYAVGETVTVTTAGGETLGSGELYIHNAWNAVAFAGTVEDIKVEVEDTVSAGKTIMTLTDTEYTAEFETLTKQHREYEAMMLRLFQLYQDTTLVAPCDGVVSGVDEDSVHLLSDDGEGWTFSLLANAPNGDDSIAYHNFVGKVTAMGINGWALSMNPMDLPITDYKDLSGVNTDAVAMTEVTTYVPLAPIYELVGDAWQQISALDISVGDILLFAGNDSGNFVWVVRVQKAEVGTPSIPGWPGGSGSYPSFGGDISDIIGSLGGYGGYGGGSVQEEPEFELYDLEETTILSVTPQDTMTLSIALDEQDIAKVTLGHTADVLVDAIRNESFVGTVTAIGTEGTNSGGSSKYTVELTMDRTSSMISGMNATATIVISTEQDVLTIPIAALNENGAETFVYTSYDPETEKLGSPVVVQTGRADDEHVAILSGLAPGDTVWYSYYDTLELSHTAEPGRFGFGG